MPCLPQEKKIKTKQKKEIRIRNFCKNIGNPGFLEGFYLFILFSYYLFGYFSFHDGMLHVTLIPLHDI